MSDFPLKIDSPSRGEPDAAFVTSMASRAQRGDPQAADWLYREYRDRVHSLMSRIVGQQDAEDLTQTSFLVMLGRLHQFDRRSRFWTWFYRLAVNEALQYLRKSRRRPLLSLPLDNLSSPRHSSVEDRDAVEQAFKRLPDSQRITVKLHYEDGMSYRDIADKLAIPIGTVGSRINQAKAKIANLIDPQFKTRPRCTSKPKAA